MARGDDNVVLCNEPDSYIEVWLFMSEGDMFTMMELASKTRNHRLMGVLNGLRVKYVDVNDNGYSVPPHNKSIFLLSSFVSFYL